MSTSRAVRDLRSAATSRAGSGEREDSWRCKTIRRLRTSWSGWDEVPPDRRAGSEELRGGARNLSPARLFKAGWWNYGPQDPQTTRTLLATTGACRGARTTDTVLEQPSPPPRAGTSAGRQKPPSMEMQR